MMILSFIAILGSFTTSHAKGFVSEGLEQRCKVYTTASQARLEADADKTAWTYARNTCWSYEREVGKPTTLSTGSKSCVSKVSGTVTYWTCTYRDNQCCYTP